MKNKFDEDIISNITQKDDNGDIAARLERYVELIGKAQKEHETNSGINSNGKKGTV